MPTACAMANIAQMINVLQAMIMTDKEKMVLTPTYYVFKMYVPFQDATFVPVTFDAGTYTHGDITLPRVDAIAAKDANGKLWLEITNLDPNQTGRNRGEPDRHHSQIGSRRNTDRAQGGQCQHLRGTNTVCRTYFSEGSGRQADSETGAQVVTVISVEQR